MIQSIIYFLSVVRLGILGLVASSYCNTHQLLLHTLRVLEWQSLRRFPQGHRQVHLSARVARTSPFPIGWVVTKPPRLGRGLTISGNGDLLQRKQEPHRPPDRRRTLPATAGVHASVASLSIPCMWELACVRNLRHRCFGSRPPTTKRTWRKC
jgi:hypothetical protein